jgi:hypothetical protein
VIRAVLDDHRTAPISESLRATLTFLQKLCLQPDAVDAADAQRVIATGVTKAALRDAVWVCMCFGVLTRVADALGWQLQDERGLASASKMLWKRGYIL